MHLLPPDDCGLTDETIVDFLNGLQFSNGHDALSAAERAGELLRPLERASRAARFCGDVQQAAQRVRECGEFVLQDAFGERELT